MALFVILSMIYRYEVMFYRIGERTQYIEVIGKHSIMNKLNAYLNTKIIIYFATELRVNQS